MPTILLLIVSNTFMITAWYGNLKFPDMPMWAAILTGSDLGQPAPVMILTVGNAASRQEPRCRTRVGHDREESLSVADGNHSTA